MTIKEFLVRLANTRAHGWKYKLVGVGLPGSGSTRTGIMCYYKHEYGDGLVDYNYDIFQAVAWMVSGGKAFGHVEAATYLGFPPGRSRKLHTLVKAIMQMEGYNKPLRRKLLIACGLPSAQA